MRSNIEAQLADILSGAGYKRLPPTFEVGNVTFNGMSAFVGGAGSLELVLLVAVKETTTSARTEVRWLVERVARALDSAGSQRPLTAVLVSDESLPSELVDSILKVARVLTVASFRDMTTQLAPLLPLEPLELGPEEADAVERLAPYLQKRRDAPQLRRMILDSRDGAAKVESRLSTWLDAAFSGDGTR